MATTMIQRLRELLARWAAQRHRARRTPPSNPAAARLMRFAHTKQHPADRLPARRAGERRMG